MTETPNNPLARSHSTLSLLKFAFPSMVMMLFMGLYTIVDTVFVARFVDTNALSAINIVCPVINLTVGLGTMLATGGSAVIAQKMGQQKMQEARSNLSLLILTGGSANIVFDYIFIVLLQMGIKGAAIGTGIGYLIPAAAGTLFFLTKKTELHFGSPVLDVPVLIKSICNGSSEMVGQLATAITTFLFNLSMMKLLGEDGVAAITVLIYSGFLLSTLFIGFSMGTAPVISYHYGSRNRKQLEKTVRICFHFICILSVCIFLLAFSTGRKIAAIFAGQNVRVFEITKAGFTFFSFSFLFSGSNIFASALFTALSNGKMSAAISFLRTFGFLTVFLLILPEFFRVTGVWLAAPLAELFTFILTVGLLLRAGKKHAIP